MKSTSPTTSPRIGQPHHELLMTQHHLFCISIYIMQGPLRTEGFNICQLVTACCIVFLRMTVLLIPLCLHDTKAETCHVLLTEIQSDFVHLVNKRHCGSFSLTRFFLVSVKTSQWMSVTVPLQKWCGEKGVTSWQVTCHWHCWAVTYFSPHQQSLHVQSYLWLLATINWVALSVIPAVMLQLTVL